MTEPIIETRALTKCFGEFTAVDHVSFRIEPGEVVGYLGPNGSGKTTTIRMLLGLLTPSSGEATVLGFNIATQSEEVRRRVGYMSQKFSLYDDLTVLENLEFYGGVYGVTSKGRIHEVLDLVGLVDVQKKVVSSLSTGWRQRLALGTAIVHQPAILFLDEPTSGVDPSARRDFWDLIYQLVDSGVTTLVTTHYMDEAEYCTRVGIMRSGKLLALDTPQVLKKNFLQGSVWDIHADPLLQILSSLEHSPLVNRVRLAGDHLSAITPLATTRKDLVELIEKSGGNNPILEQVDPNLEDVFLNLALEN